MGTINYKSNKILVTLATKYYYPSDDEINEEINFQKEENDCNMTREETIDILIENYNFWLAEDMETIKNIINNYNFEFYNIKIECGYYEGFQILIDFKYIYFDDTAEKKQAQKELTQLKKLLLHLINNFSLFACVPSWCTTFYTTAETIHLLNESIKIERLRLNNLKTERTFNFKTLYNY